VGAKCSSRSQGGRCNPTQMRGWDTWENLLPKTYASKPSLNEFHRAERNPISGLPAHRQGVTPHSSSDCPVCSLINLVRQGLYLSACEILPCCESPCQKERRVYRGDLAISEPAPFRHVHEVVVEPVLALHASIGECFQGSKRPFVPFVPGDPAPLNPDRDRREAEADSCYAARGNPSCFCRVSARSPGWLRSISS